MISEREKIQLKLEIYKDILDCFPCPKINFLESKGNIPDIDMSLFEGNLEDKIEEIKLQLNVYKKVEREMEYEKYKRNKTNSRTNNKKRKD